MRLFLSSYRAGTHDNKLLDFLGGINKVGIITNAKDYHEPVRRAERVKEEFDYFKSLGIEPEEINLRPFFHRAGVEGVLEQYSFIWLAGGNTFLLRRALRYSKVDNYLTSKVLDNTLVLGGESAGALVAGPTLKGIEMEGDSDSPHFVPKGYDSEIVWEGLDLVSYVPVPHVGSEGYGAEIQRVIDRLDQAGIPHKDMKDGQAISIDRNEEKFLA